MQRYDTFEICRGVFLPLLGYLTMMLREEVQSAHIIAGMQTPVCGRIHFGLRQNGLAAVP